MRTRRSESDAKLCRIFEVYSEIAAFVSWNKLLLGRNACLGYMTSLECFFFYAVHPRIYGYEMLPSLVSARKVTFGSTVSCKRTRQLRHLDSINSSFRLN